MPSEKFSENSKKLVTVGTYKQILPSKLKLLWLLIICFILLTLKLDSAAIWRNYTLVTLRGEMATQRSNSNDIYIHWLVLNGKQRRKNSSSLQCCVQLVLYSFDAFESRQFLQLFRLPPSDELLLTNLAMMFHTLYQSVDTQSAFVFLACSGNDTSQRLVFCHIPRLHRALCLDFHHVKLCGVDMDQLNRKNKRKPL